MTIKIWLADLTYTQQTIASDVVPAAVGGIGTYIRKHLGAETEIRIFKFPEDLSDAFEKDQPTIMGFSNYIWNARLSYGFAQAIKRKRPEIIVIFGGPNFPIIPHEQEQVLRDHPEIDYYLMKEGEVPFVKVLQELIKVDFNKERFSATACPNVAYINPSGQFCTSPELERISDLADLPSPYLSGDLDPYLDGRLLPVVQTNRGCPFTCTFCTEGQSYWTRVRFKKEDLIQNELTYIAERMNKLPASKKRTDLLIADSNFGMYPDDLKTCRVIATTQKDYEYPKYINVATGKNSKERVLEAARLVNGAMKLAGSVQSLDPEVMKNIKRANISADKIMEMAIRSADIGTNTYSEVILALPGDSKAAHFKTLETLIDSGFNTICMYQLMMLPGTELSMESTREKYKMVTRYRVLPRCFGYYDFLGEKIVTAEIEEICIQNSTLSYADYLDCRRMNMIVNVFYNEGVFAELIPLLQMAHVSPWQWIYRIYSRHYNKDFDAMVAEFVRETENELWLKKDELETFINKPEAMDRYREGELGRNLAFKYKALSITSHFDCVTDVAQKSIIDILTENNASEDYLAMAQEIVQFNHCRIKGIFDENQTMEGVFQFDIPLYSSHVTKEGLERYKLSFPVKFTFANSQEQIDSLQSYISLFGKDSLGLSRILSRVFFKKLMRIPKGEEANSSTAV